MQSSDKQLYPSLYYRSRFVPSLLDHAEHTEDYCPGGLHPVAIGDIFGRNGYRVIHKLGYGGSSTIWLARNASGKLVTLKVMRADMSTAPLEAIPEINVPLALSKYIAKHALGPSHLQSLDDHFLVDGPNGTHLCLVYQVAGPSVRSMHSCPGRVCGSRRFRKDLAQKIMKQVIYALSTVHAAGFVHGDITTSNILLKCKPQLELLSDDEVYLHFGKPVTEDVETVDDDPLGPHVPPQLVESISDERWAQSSFLQEDVMLIDFGQSYAIANPPKDYVPGTIGRFQSPEARFTGTICPASDVWALGCTLFEVRGGRPLFEDFLGGDVHTLKDTVATLGKPPTPMWEAFEQRLTWFDEDGNVKPEMPQETMFPAEKSSIRLKLEDIGVQDMAPRRGDDGPLMERLGTRLDEPEIQLLEDLLSKMLRYRSKERVDLEAVLSHPWFST